MVDTDSLLAKLEEANRFVKCSLRIFVLFKNVTHYALKSVPFNMTKIEHLIFSLPFEV